MTNISNDREILWDTLALDELLADVHGIQDNLNDTIITKQKIKIDPLHQRDKIINSNSFNVIMNRYNVHLREEPTRLRKQTLDRLSNPMGKFLSPTKPEQYAEAKQPLQKMPKKNKTNNHKQAKINEKISRYNPSQIPGKQNKYLDQYKKERNSYLSGKKKTFITESDPNQFDEYNTSMISPNYDMGMDLLKQYGNEKRSIVSKKSEIKNKIKKKIMVVQHARSTRSANQIYGNIDNSEIPETIKPKKSSKITREKVNKPMDEMKRHKSAPQLSTNMNKSRKDRLESIRPDRNTRISSMNMNVNNSLKTKKRGIIPDILPDDGLEGDNKYVLKNGLPRLKPLDNNWINESSKPNLSNQKYRNDGASQDPTQRKHNHDCREQDSSSNQPPSKNDVIDATDDKDMTSGHVNLTRTGTNEKSSWVKTVRSFRGSKREETKVLLDFIGFSSPTKHSSSTDVSTKDHGYSSQPVSGKHNKLGLPKRGQKQDPRLNAIVGEEGPIAGTSFVSKDSGSLHHHSMPNGIKRTGSPPIDNVATNSLSDTSNLMKNMGSPNKKMSASSRTRDRNETRNRKSSGVDGGSPSNLPPIQISPIASPRVSISASRGRKDKIGGSVSDAEEVVISANEMTLSRRSIASEVVSDALRRVQALEEKWSDTLAASSSTNGLNTGSIAKKSQGRPPTQPSLASQLAAHARKINSQLQAAQNFTDQYRRLADDGLNWNVTNGSGQTLPEKLSPQHPYFKSLLSPPQNQIDEHLYGNDKESNKLIQLHKTNDVDADETEYDNEVFE